MLNTSGHAPSSAAAAAAAAADDDDDDDDDGTESRALHAAQRC